MQTSGYGRPQIRFGGPLTFWVKILLISNVAVFFLQLLLHKVVFNAGPFQGPVMDLFALNPTLALTKGFIWQFLSHAFLHSTAGLGHIGFNMLVLWMFAGDLENRWGSKAFIRYYLLCAGGAGVIWAGVNFFASPPNTWVVGASGALFGIFLAYGLTFPERTVLLMFIIPIKMKYLVWIMGLIEVYMLIGGRGGNIANLAHLGGMVVGLIYLKRWYRLGQLYRDLKYSWLKRKFKIVDPEDDPFWH